VQTLLGDQSGAPPPRALLRHLFNSSSFTTAFCEGLERSGLRKGDAALDKLASSWKCSLVQCIQLGAAACESADEGWRSAGERGGGERRRRRS
jgi:hypothetical protein